MSSRSTARARSTALAGAFGAAVLILAIVLRIHARSDGATGVAEATLPTDLMAEAVSEASFERALEPRPFEFPRDHAAHEDFRTEWWYFTGHLEDTAGGAYGFQLTLFRFELDDRDEPSASAWRTPRVFLGHFALTDVDAARFHAFERMSRAHPDMAGVRTSPPGVWLDEWSVRLDPATGRWQIAASQAGVALALELDPASAPIAQGEGGLSQKSGAPGNASHYYSVPRLSAAGTLTLSGERRDVGGTAWLDREWSTSALDRGQAGWDWFALQLDDGATLMFYRLRRDDGSVDPHSAGTWVSASGEVTRLDARAVRVTPLAHWTSTQTGARYPTRTRLVVPALDLDVEVSARVEDQEWRGRFRYWEGAATVSGSRAGAPVAGLGYVELTGYR